MMYTYWKLTDKKHTGMVLRIDHANGSEHVHLPDKGWTATGISPSYLFDFGEHYGEYEVITEQEALDLIA